MEDENKKKIINSIIFIIAIIVISVIIILIYLNDKNGKIENKLKKEKFTKVTGKIYTKDIEKDNYQINYTYNIQNKEYMKTILNKNQTESIMMTYKDGQIKISYTNNQSCIIYQTGIYSKDNFNCKIIEKTNGCKPKCDIMLKNSKEFMKEIQKY